MPVDSKQLCYIINYYITHANLKAFVIRYDSETVNLTWTQRRINTFRSFEIGSEWTIGLAQLVTTSS